MNASLLDLLARLKKNIENDPRVLLLNELDRKINNDEEVMKLAYQKDMALLSYEDSLKHFGEESKETKAAQKRLYEAKLSLDNNELVKQYNLAYKQVRIMYEIINEELFNDFKNKHRCLDD